MANQYKTMCPSVPHWSNDSMVFGVISGTVDKPELVPLKAPQPVTAELLALAEPVDPTEVFRFAGPCSGTACLHFDKETTKCRLVEKTVRWAPKVSDKLIACSIRSTCKWWTQEGRAACNRCTQVATNNLARLKSYEAIVDPSVL